MLLNNLTFEFEQMISIAQEIIVDRQTQDMPIDQFLQLVLDMRNSERENVDLSDKNIIIPDRNILQ